MSFAEQNFYDLLRTSRESGKLTWYFTRYREIRAVATGRQQNYDNCMCPLTAVHWLTTAGNHLRPQQWQQAAHQMHMDEATAGEIVKAADWEPTCNMILRSKLREVCGLSDVLDAVPC